MPDELYGLSAADVATLREMARSYRGGENVPRPRHQRKRLPFRYPGGGFTMCNAGTSNGNTLSPTSEGSSSSDPKIIRLTFVSEPEPSFAEIVGTSTKFVRVKTTGKYWCALHAQIEWPEVTGDCQEIQVQLGKRVGISGSDVFSYVNINATVGRSGFSSSLASSSHWGQPQVVEFDEDDHLTMRAYHGDAGHTKVSVSVGFCTLIMMPYNH